MRYLVFAFIIFVTSCGSQSIKPEAVSENSQQTPPLIREKQKQPAPASGVIDQASLLYVEATFHLKQGKLLFRKAMTDTSGGKARAVLCSDARKEFFRARQKAAQYSKLTGKGEDLLTEIQMHDYQAMKMAPANVWSPPEVPGED